MVTPAASPDFDITEVELGFGVEERVIKLSNALIRSSNDTLTGDNTLDEHLPLSLSNSLDSDLIQRDDLLTVTLWLPLLLEMLLFTAFSLKLVNKSPSFELISILASVDFALSLFGTWLFGDTLFNGLIIDVLFGDEWDIDDDWDLVYIDSAWNEERLVGVIVGAEVEE